MSIFINNQIHNNQSLLSILFGKKTRVPQLVEILTAVKEIL